MGASAVGLLLQSLIGAGTSLYAGEQEQKALGEARQEAMGLAQQQRLDSLRQQKFARQSEQEGTALQREQMGLTERLQSAQIAQQGARDMAQRQQEKYSRALGIINSNTQLKNRLRSLFGGS